jgi:hypothetical protein
VADNGLRAHQVISRLSMSLVVALSDKFTPHKS